jgi:putative membrane protein
LRVLYYGILISHVFLAVVVTPMVVYTAYLGLKDRLRRHVWLARWTLPIWLYVSITGVIVYWMLYRLYPVE